MSETVKEPVPTVEPRTIGWDIAVQVIGRFANLALGIFVTALLARTLGNEGFGIWSTLLAISAVIAVIGNPGLEQVAIRSAVAHSEREPQWLGALLVLRQLLSLLAFALCVAAVWLIAPDSQSLLAGVIIVLSLLTASASSLRVVFQLRVRNSLAIGVMTAQSVAWAAFILWAHESGAGIVALAIGLTVTTSISSFLLGGMALRLASIRFDRLRRHGLELLKAGIPVAIGSMLVTGYGQIDQILVFRLAGSEDAGLYAAAYRVFSQSSFVPVSVSTTVFALLAASYTAEGERFRNLMQASLELLLAFSAGGLVLAAVYSGEIVELIFGAGFERAAPALPILMAAFVFVSIGYLQDLLVIISRQQTRFVLVALLALALNVALNIALIPRYGFMAAAWITLATEIFVVAARWLIVRGKLPSRPVLGRIPRVVLAAAAYFGLLLAAAELDVPFGCVLAGSVGVYPLLLFAVGAIGVEDLRLIGARKPRPL